jgi:outer membrane protein OmpU
MNNLKKIGLTALAGSLVATSVAYAGELTATGAASMTMENNSNSAAGKTISMGNSIYLAGSGETDGGLNVNVSFELDQGNADGAAGVYDNHFVSVGNDALGTVTVHGHGGSNAASALDTTAAGDLWDNGFGIAKANKPGAAASGAGLVVYSLPTIADGVALSASYASGGENYEGSTALGVVYTGVEGLTVSYGQGEDASGKNVEIDQRVMKASYAVGSFTLSASDNDYDHTSSANDKDVRSYNVAYTLTDEISVSYGEETHAKFAKTADIEVSGVTASYTSGGMTVSVASIKADDVDMSSSTAQNDNEYWKLGLSFAF